MRSNPSLPRVYRIAEDSNRFDGERIGVKNTGISDRNLLNPGGFVELCPLALLFVSAGSIGGKL